jgi:hypothetical protein
MMQGPIPQNYDEWRHCITVECGIPLTTRFVEERITAMQDVNDFRTRQFVQLYGADYHRQVLAWFTQARDALSTN